MKINEELRKLIPPLKDSEYDLLEQSLLKDGCREALITWQGTLIDGHNRYEICEKHKIEYKTVEIELDDLDAVKIWMIDNQSGRRNLSDGWRFELMQVKRDILKPIGLAKQKEAIKNRDEKGRAAPLLSIVDKTGSAPHNTQKAIAEELGWSTGKVAMADKVWKESQPEVIDQLKAGELSINEAYKQMKKEAKKKEMANKIETIKASIEAEPQTFDGLFDVLAIDPPWPYGRKYDPETSRVANPYPEMSIKDIKNIELPIKENAVVFLWTTHAFLKYSFDILDKWGLNYKATMVWDKEKMGMGATIRMQCEFCLIALKGKPVINGSGVRDIIREPRREHSRKPKAFFSFVEEFAPGRKMDYFSREEKPGWVSYGAETNKF